MSTHYPQEVRCSACGTVSKFMVLGSTNTFGGTPDLDLRPPEMERSTMPLWIHRCPHCGYVSGDVDDQTTVTVEYLASEEYRSCGGIEFRSGLAMAFYQYYMINVIDGNAKDAFHAVLHAAWACDDEEDCENAVRCRRIAMELADRLIEENRDDDEVRATLSLMKTDFMRRAGMFDEVLARYGGVKYGNDLMDRILAFQLILAEKKDDKCYRFSDMPEEQGEIDQTNEQERLKNE